VTISSFFTLLPFLLGLAAVQADDPADDPQPTMRRMVVERAWIVRVPVRPRPLLQRFDWIESKGPQCLPASAIRGALLSGTDHVDFLLPQRRRMRATFDEDCPALDFYGGFYLKTDDHRVCARRDSVHSRIGGSCRIDRFRRLIPRLKVRAVAGKD